MSRPLQYGDPRQLGPYRLRGRLSEGPAGVVYLGEARDGRSVSLALLSDGAAGDAAARDRFRAAVLQGDGVPDRPQVLAADPESSAPWAAVPHEAGRPGAEAFLAPVVTAGQLSGVARGPGFAPYWAGASGPARRGWGGLPAVAGFGRPSGRSAAPLVIALIVLFLLLLLLLLLLLALLSGPSEDARPTPSPAPSSATPSQSQSPSPSSSPSPSQSGSPSPSQSPSPGQSPTPSPSGSPGPRPTGTGPEPTDGPIV
ncbi:MAG: hypothetical protein GEV11_19675 [Streptosporangiales bacterium]|nr:hypothetical protein [Streptosporangiales bacterium]